MSRPHLVAIVGPTAAGKTAVALAAAQHAAVEVISADSRQVRREMRIGTAAPTEDELAAVHHHLVGVVAPDAPWSLSDWLTRARTAVDEVHARGALPVLVGGTGQYVWALLEGWEVPAVPPDSAFRANLEARATAGEGPALYARLREVDPASADRIDPRNVRRVIRALEIVEVTGHPVQPRQRRDPGFDWHAVGLHWSREDLHRRADARARAMFEGGLLDEVRGLIARYGRDFDALGSIGYREALGVLDGDLTVEEAIRRAEIETHRLIRMQANWFRQDDQRIRWIPGQGVEAAAMLVTRSVEP